jgi:hypothetical protein
MKKIFISLLCVLAFASICFANDVETVSGARTTQDFVGSDPFIFYSYVYDSGDSATQTPAKEVTNNPVLRVSFWSHLTQIWHRYYIVTDPAGTMVFFDNSNSSSLSGGTQFFGAVTPSLGVGDYIFTFVSAGAVDGLVVSDQFSFSVR